MGFYLSPIVDINEVDLSTTIPAVATSIGVIILRGTYKGPERKTTLITNIDDLITTFGKPTSTADCYRDILSAAGFLKYGNKLYCTRSMAAGATFSGTKATSGASATFVPYTVDNAYKLTDFNSEDPDEFADEVAPSGTDPMWFIANSRGTNGNNVRIAVVDYTTYTAMIQEGTHSDWATYSDIVSIDSPMDDTTDFLVVVSAKDQGETTWTVKESWNVSTDEDKTDDEGVKKFAETVINGRSKYIEIALNPLQVDNTITLSTEDYQQFGGGQIDDAVTPLGITDAIIMTDLDLYSNAEDIDVNIFIDSDKSTTIKQYITTICGTTRKDCIGILDCLYADVVNNSGSEATDLRLFRNTTLNENDSYVSLYGNWLNVYDKWNGRYRWVPVSGYVGGIFANTDDVTDPWFAPAGLNRALLTSVRKLAWNPTLGERDILYKNGINPIVSFSGQGKVVWGQKTLLDKSSAFNRINVRRLFLVLEKAISTASKYFLFEPNDNLTRLLLMNMIDPFLRDVRSRRGVYEYLVVCDETNNTGERIDRNELWCDIYIKPTRAAEFIVLNFIATKTGVSFTEIQSGSA